MWLFRVWWVFAPSLCVYEQRSAHFHNHENQFYKSWLLINAFLHSNRSIKTEPRLLLLVLLCEFLKGTIHFPCLGTYWYRMYLLPQTGDSQKTRKVTLTDFRELSFVFLCDQWAAPAEFLCESIILHLIIFSVDKELKNPGAFMSFLHYAKVKENSIITCTFILQGFLASWLSGEGVFYSSGSQCFSRCKVVHWMHYSIKYSSQLIGRVEYRMHLQYLGRHQPWECLQLYQWSESATRIVLMFLRRWCWKMTGKCKALHFERRI